MASPIRWFRKHAQFFVVIFGVVLMGIFGLGTVFTSLNPADFVSGGGEDTNKVVAQWSGGELRKEDLFRLRQRHFASRRFLNHVYQFAVKENGDKPFPIAVPQIVPLARPGTEPTVEQMDDMMITRLLFAKKAADEGFIVDEKMAYDYIAQYGGDVSLSPNMLKQLNRDVNQGIPLSAIVRHVQTELLAQQMESLARGGFPFDNRIPISAGAINPTEAMQLFAKSNKQIECEVLAIPVEEYVSTISTEPAESELRAIYEEGRYDYPDPTFETPGFKKFKQARIQYFIGELDTFLQNEMAKLTDAEVQAEYDRLLAADDDFVMQVVPEDDASNGDPDGAQDGLDLGDPAPAPQSESNSGESESDGTEPVEEMAPATEEENDSDKSDPVEMPDASKEKTNAVLKLGEQDEKPKVQEAAEAIGGRIQAGSDSKENVLRSAIKQEEMPMKKLDEPMKSDKPETPAVEPAVDTGDAKSGDAAITTEKMTDEKVAADQAQDPAIEDEPKVIRRPKPLADVSEELKLSLIHI